MSLIGSLEDLALGDILQIVSLSRKSGLLLLRSEQGDGRIFFRDGLVQAAYVKGEPEDLRALLLAGGFAEAEGLDVATQAAHAQGRSVEEAIASSSGLSQERVEALCREHVERAVLRMFGWHVGEFSFEVRSDMDARDLSLSLPNGINAQYLTIEASRQGDEREGDEEAADEAQAEDDFVLSGELEPGAGDAAAHELLAVAAAASVGEAVPSEADAVPSEADAPEPAAVGAADTESLPSSAAGVADVATPQPVASAEPSLPLVVIDPELAALEWVKSHLSASFARIHIFQHSEGGIARIRQYLSRTQVPVVLVSTRAPADSLSGSADVVELLSRLRAQAPRMPIVAMCETDAEVPTGVDAADALVTRPSVSALADPKRSADALEAGEHLIAAMRPFAFPAQAALSPSPAPSRRTNSADASLKALKDMSERLRDRATRGEVLNLVLDFAAEHFRRVAMFMVCEEDAVGIAQRGLPRADGPSDEKFLALRVPLHESAWLRSVLDTGESLRAGPSDEGDRRLAAKLGSGLPIEAFLAPIESGGRVAALLYCDNLPENTPIGDTTVLAIVLHEAGLALERAVLERALARADGSGR